MFLFYILYNVLLTRFYRCPWYPDGFLTMLPLLLMMVSEAHKMVLKPACPTFRNTCQPNLIITQIWPPKKNCSHSAGSLFDRFFNCLLLSNIRKFYIQIFSFIFNFLGLTFSKLLCFSSFRLYRLQFKQLSDSCSKPQDPNTLQMN